MANTKSSDQKQALIIRMIADELRGPGAACFMGEKDSWDAALAIVEGLRAAGYVIVPLEPTEVMIEVMIEVGMVETADSCWPENVAAAWRAMVGAAR